jgi:methylglyoxal synthase
MLPWCIFFVDPLTAMPHDVDVKALMRLAIVYDVPWRSTAPRPNAFCQRLDERPTTSLRRQPGRAETDPA